MPGLDPFLPSLQLPAYICRNCGLWQRFFEEPHACPLCLDSRHVMPTGGWAFYDLETAREAFPTHWEELLPGLWRYWNDPVDGIGSHSYLLCGESGNILFEGAAVYSDEALDHMKNLGGVRFASASHPHTYGALWQIQDHFNSEIALHTADFEWSGAFRVTYPFGETLELAPGLTLIHTGVHFAGHAVLHDARRGILFCGDALKFAFQPDSPRNAKSISTHKAFVRGVPLTKGEARHYRRIFAALPFTKTYTPFEQIHNVGSDAIEKFFDRVEQEYPQPEFISVDSISTVT